MTSKAAQQHSFYLTSYALSSPLSRISTCHAQPLKYFNFHNEDDPLRPGPFQARPRRYVASLLHESKTQSACLIPGCLSFFLDQKSAYVLPLIKLDRSIICIRQYTPDQKLIAQYSCIRQYTNLGASDTRSYFSYPGKKDTYKLPNTVPPPPHPHQPPTPNSPPSPPPTTSPIPIPELNTPSSSGPDPFGG